MRRWRIRTGLWLDGRKGGSKIPYIGDIGGDIKGRGGGRIKVGKGGIASE